MDISKLKKLSREELQDFYEPYLIERGLKPRAVGTYRNDAFYIYKNHSKEKFWEVIESTDSQFEDFARETLYNVLLKNSRGDINTNINGYMSILRGFRDYILAEA